MKHLQFTVLLIGLLSIFFYKKGNAQCAEQDIRKLRKTAIVIGESNYDYKGSLTNPVHDAKDMTDSLRKIGFSVSPYYDIGRKALDSAISKWYEKIKNFDVALFYFSGHGAEVNDQNYLFPIDIDPKNSFDLNNEALSANKVLDQLNQMENTNLKYSIIILDACRDNPFTKGWTRSVANEGLSQMSPKGGTFIAYAALPGATASDGERRNGSYTEAILKYITIPNLTIDQIFNRVNSYVNNSTHKLQVPYVTSTLGSEYCFSVRPSPRSNSKPKFSEYIQPNSGILLSHDEQNVFTIENNGHGISIRDTRSLDIINSMNRGFEKAKLISAKNDETLFVSDSVSHLIKVVDWKKIAIRDSLKIDYTPLALITSTDKLKLYTAGNGADCGIISLIDTRSNSIIKNTALTVEISKMVISNDGRFLYVTSKPVYKKLLIIDAKSLKPIKEISVSDIGNAVGVLPDGKKLYVGNETGRKTYVIDLNTFEIIKTLAIPASDFAFTLDSRFVYALTQGKVAMIRSVNDDILYEYSMPSTPTGLTFSTDGTGFTWLPKESQVSSFFLADTAESLKNAIDLNQRLKKFKEQINKYPEVDETKKRNEMCSKFNRCLLALERGLVSPTIDNLIRKDFNILYAPSSSFNNPTNCFKQNGDFNYGIHLISDGKKSVVPTFHFQFTDDKVVLTVKDAQIDTVAETITFFVDKSKVDKMAKNYGLNDLPLDDTTANDVRTFVRNYFIKRLEYLLK